MTKNRSELVFGEDLSDRVKELFLEPNTYAVTDKNVIKLYPNLFDLNKTLVFAAGEKTKTIKNVEKVCEWLIAKSGNRKTHIVAVGGGVIGDLTGFAAASFMRGIDWSLVPTTLLAMVDSSVGGKTGVNCKKVKNTIGAFWLPRKVLISTHFTKTLPQREYICGIGEVIKTAALDKEIWNYYTDNEQDLLEKLPHKLTTVIKKCAKFKESVVEIDPLETTGLRKILNYGHTIGHALETLGGYKKSHGEYVLEGLKIETEIFKNDIDHKFFEKINSLIDNALISGQNEQASSQKPKLKFNIEKVVQLSLKDKKNETDKISFIVYNSPSSYKEIFKTQEELKNALRQ